VVNQRFGGPPRLVRRAFNFRTPIPKALLGFGIGKGRFLAGSGGGLGRMVSSPERAFSFDAIRLS
jgi:hypothetical protein